MKKTIVEILSVIFGSFLFALSINLFVIPNELGEGGVTGTTIILYYLFGWSPSITLARVRLSIIYIYIYI